VPDNVIRFWPASARTPTPLGIDGSAANFAFTIRSRSDPVMLRSALFRELREQPAAARTPTSTTTDIHFMMAS
jgi:hypothetical protein